MVKPSKEEGEAKGKRSSDPDDMKAVRKLVAPLQYDIEDPNSVNAHECEVMMVSPDEESFALTAEDPPGLAILDSGCTRTMHGKAWPSMSVCSPSGSTRRTVRSTALRLLEALRFYSAGHSWRSLVPSSIWPTRRFPF